MADFIGIEVQGISELQAKLTKLPKEAAAAGIDASTEYAINVLRQYPPQRRVTRTEAYGVPFFTDRQRRGYFARLHEGSIAVPYHRTQELARSWRQIDRGMSSIIVNEAPHASLVMGRGTQSRMSQKIGWKTPEAILRERLPRLMEKFEAGVKKAMRRLGL